MKVLVVDDTATNRQIVQVFLKKLGHVVALAEDGVQAVEKFREGAFDLVLMDVMMPVMDGYEATRQIKALSGDRWVPVVFLSALDKDENLVAGLDAGGDDYMSKPINFVVLQAKLRSLTRSIQVHQRLAEARTQLQVYHDSQEAENVLAASILTRQLNRRSLADPAVQAWLAPAAAVSGDVYAAARAPTGELFVMLADATGHGLAASISTLPLLTLFYEMVDWGMALSAIVARINDQLCQALPSGRFVAATLLMIDDRNPAVCLAEAWVGGVPAVLLLAPDGSLLRELKSTNMALGVVEADEAMSAVVRLELTQGSQFVLYSDGVPEAENAAGEAFGMERLRSVLAAAPAERRIEAMQTALQLHIGDCEPHDDVTLLLVDCGCN